MKWICCQLGAREHYAIPRALFRQDSLEHLLTDAWAPPRSILRIVGERKSEIRDRWHEELEGASVTSFNWSLIAFEILARARRLRSWPLILARNRWFQRKVVKALTSGIGSQTSESPILLSYCYTALKPFHYAKSRGWKTVLVQIDPGPEEERIVVEEAARVPQLAADWQAAPSEYWSSWREECMLADRIVVNSEWSREGLVRGGVPSEKMSVIPLAYELGLSSGGLTDPRLQREYPDRFTSERPLRVLFLGLINLRKGVARLLEAARILRGEPVEFWMVGPVEIANASTSGDRGRLRWFGPVTREKAADYYKGADVFILPTLSDGFALTQLEAQADGLPVIASKNCGKVVENGVNGIILDEPSAMCIAHAVHDCIASPDRLNRLATASRLRDKFTLENFANQLQRLGATL
jgi:glycosyltransferase involved in cell wall biosynthesis